MILSIVTQIVAIVLSRSSAIAMAVDYQKADQRSYNYISAYFYALSFPYVVVQSIPYFYTLSTFFNQKCLYNCLNYGTLLQETNPKCIKKITAVWGKTRFWKQLRNKNKIWNNCTTRFFYFRFYNLKVSSHINTSPANRVLWGGVLAVFCRKFKAFKF